MRDGTRVWWRRSRDDVYEAALAKAGLRGRAWSAAYLAVNAVFATGLAAIVAIVIVALYLRH